MIFTGDVAIAHDDRFIFKNMEHLHLKSWIINLEGFVTSESSYSKKWCVYNTTKWDESFIDFNIKAAFIGNNHIQDIENGVSQSISYLSKRNIPFFGAGSNVEEKCSSVSVRVDSVNYRLLGFGWSVIGCKAGSQGSPGVNSFDYDNVISQTKFLLKSCDDTRLVIVIHGNYEFESSPQPGHRKIARELIDLGVYSVIFHHPHIVGPIERYKGRTIAYSLGNWAFSYGKYFDGKLKFPDKSFPQIALEFSEDGDVVHHALFVPPATVEFLGSELIHSEGFALKPEFEGFSDSEYYVWFKENRLKNKLLPIYTSTDNSLKNWFKDSWVHVRHLIVDTMAKIGIKAMRSK